MKARTAIYLLPLFFSAGCGIHYYDQATGTEHLWGIGHLKMKAAASGGTNASAVVRGAGIAGLSLGTREDGFHISLGYDSRRRISIYDDTIVSLEWPRVSWPSDDFFSVRIGTNTPSLFYNP